MSDLIDAHVRFLRAKNASPETIRKRVWLLRKLHDWLPFGILYASTDELEDFVNAQTHWGDWARATYTAHMRGFYRWAVIDWLEIDPTVRMAVPRSPDRVPHPVTEEQFAHALANAPEPWHTAIALAGCEGLRCAEAAGVWREDVNEERTRIDRAKGGGQAWIDTHPYVWGLVKDRPFGPLMRTPTGKPMYGKWLTTHERRFFDSIGLYGVTLHWFRHRFATMLLNLGYDLRTVQEAMRHKSVMSTQGYTLVAGGQRRLAIRSLPTPTRPLSKENQAPQIEPPQPDDGIWNPTSQVE